MEEKQYMESQIDSDRSYVDLGLTLTERVIATKMKLKQINPTLIYQWDGQTFNNQISGKGTFKVRNSLSNELVFQCEVRKWVEGVPSGKIKLRKINFYTNSGISDYKVKEIQTYQGQSFKLKKDGKGVYTLYEFYSSGKVKNISIQGQWDNDVLIEGQITDPNGTKDLDLQKNIQFSKSSKSIKIVSQKGKQKNVQKAEKRKEVFKERPSNHLAVERKSQVKFLHPQHLRF